MIFIKGKNWRKNDKLNFVKKAGNIQKKKLVRLKSQRKAKTNRQIRNKNKNGQKTGKERLTQKSENNCRLDTKLPQKKDQSRKKKQAK